MIFSNADTNQSPPLKKGLSTGKNLFKRYESQDDFEGETGHPSTKKGPPPFGGAQQ